MRALESIKAAIRLTLFLVENALKSFGDTKKSFSIYFPDTWYNSECSIDVMVKLLYFFFILLLLAIATHIYCTAGIICTQCSQVCFNSL
jgi:hypothetical protein